MTTNPHTAFTRGFGVKAGLTPAPGRTRRRYVENTDYAAFAARILRAHGRRVAEGDIEALPELVELSVQLEDAITAAVTGLRDRGYSWADIATRLGITRQAAHQRWGNAA